jgi:hypothetical protein
VEPNRKQAVIAIVAAILAARKLSTVPPNSPAYVAAIADAVADARKIVDRVEKSSSRSRRRLPSSYKKMCTPENGKPKYAALIVS